MVSQNKMKKILFITLTNIGDVVLTLPSLDYLKNRFEDASFTVLSGPTASILFSQDPRIKENIAFRRVLVFCKYGVGRSPSIVIGYLCSTGFSYKEAIKFIISKKADVTPPPKLEQTIKSSLKKLTK